MEIDDAKKIKQTDISQARRWMRKTRTDRKILVMTKSTKYTSRTDKYKENTTPTVSHQKFGQNSCLWENDFLLHCLINHRVTNRISCLYPPSLSVFLLFFSSHLFIHSCSTLRLSTILTDDNACKFHFNRTRKQ